jgi:hypothetical protein
MGQRAREGEEVEEEMDLCLGSGEEKCKKGEKGKCKQIRLALGEYILLPLPRTGLQRLELEIRPIPDPRAPRVPSNQEKW